MIDETVVRRKTRRTKREAPQPQFDAARVNSDLQMRRASRQDHVFGGNLLSCQYGNATGLDAKQTTLAILGKCARSDTTIASHMLSKDAGWNRA